MHVHHVHIKKVPLIILTITFTNMHWFFWCLVHKWILIILVNLLRCVPCTSLTWWCNVDIIEIMSFTVHVTLSPCCRERDAKSLSFQRCGHPIRQIWIPWTTASVVSFKEGVLFADLWCEGVKRTSAERVEAAGPHHHRSRSDCTVDSGVVVWMPVFAWIVKILNINFEPVNFCCVLFVSSILVPVNAIDINTCKVLILCEMC